MVQLALVVLASLAPASATAAPVLRVSLPEGLACPSPDELLQSLSRRFGADRVAAGQPSGNELGLSLAQLPDELEIDLVSKPGGAPFRRRLPAREGSCADLAETIGLLVDAWLRDLPWHGVGFLRDVPETVRPGPPESAARPVPVTPAVTPPLSPGRRDALTLRLGGGASLGSDATNFGPEVTLSADVSVLGGLGAAVFATELENASATDRLSSTATASISAHRQVFALAARYAFFAQDANGPRVFAGVALQAFESRSSGYTLDPSNFELVPAGFVAGLWQLRISGNLSAYAQLSATIGPKIDFDVSLGGVPRPVLSLPPAWFDGTLGLALSFF